MSQRAHPRRRAHLHVPLRRAARYLTGILGSDDGPSATGSRCSRQPNELSLFYKLPADGTPTV
jgi:hypothetical protein